MENVRGIIVYVTAGFPLGKAEVWAVNEVNSLIELGFEVIILPRDGDKHVINRDVEKFLSRTVRLPLFNKTIAFTFVRAIFSSPLLIAKLIKENYAHADTIIDFAKGLIVIPKSLHIGILLRNKKIQHIHALQTTSTAFIAYTLSVCLRVPWSFTLHTSETILKKNKYKRSLLFYSRHASMCRTISMSTARDLSNFVGLPLSEKVKMVRLGVDVSMVSKNTVDRNDWFTIVTPAELAPRKGHIFSLLAAKLLVDSGFRSFKWFFYGSGPLLNELISKVVELELGDHCFFMGNIDRKDLLEKYRDNEVDVVVLSSVSTESPEGVPVSLMEAMSFEIPVIATDCGGTKELVDGRTGVLVQEKDPVSIANSLSELISDLEHRKNFGRDGRIKVVNEFNTLKNAKELSELFSNI
jgi:colanic acid/amylovoran biosynthesis glycosyltransferase